MCLSKLLISFLTSKVCVCVYRFIYSGGDLNLSTHRLMGTRVTVGPKLRSPWVQNLINHTELVFLRK